MRLDAQQPGRIGEHRPRVGLGEPVAFEHVEEHLGVTAGHVGIALALRGRVAEVAPAVDHLLRRAAADPQLQPAAGDEVRRAGVLGHVQRVLVAHVDDGRADLDCARPRADRRKQRKRRAELAREMVHAEVRAVGAQFLGGDGELDRLEQRVGRGAYLRAVRIRPVPERQEPDLLQRHASIRHAVPLRARGCASTLLMVGSSKAQRPCRH